MERMVRFRLVGHPFVEVPLDLDDCQVQIGATISGHYNTLPVGDDGLEWKEYGFFRVVGIHTELEGGMVVNCVVIADEEIVSKEEMLAREVGS